MPSPLFPRFNQNQRQQSALNQFRGTSYGRAVQRLGQRYGGNVPEAELRRLVQRYGNQFDQAVSQYSRRSIVDRLLDNMGGFGHLIGALLRPSGRPMVGPQLELDAAKHLLESFGYKVSEPEKVQEPPKRPPVYIDSDPATKEDAVEDLPKPGTPLVEGMIPVTSSNVHSIGYEWAAQEGQPGNLLVRFLAGSGKERSGPGPLYRYRDVPRAVFVAFKMASSKGKFVWDELRVRGTVSGHQYQYELAGTGFDDYIPRQAGLMRGMTGEYFLKRSFQGRQSQKPERPYRTGHRQLPGYENAQNLKFRAGRRTK